MTGTRVKIQYRGLRSGLRDLSNFETYLSTGVRSSLFVKMSCVAHHSWCTCNGFSGFLSCNYMSMDGKSSAGIYKNPPAQYLFDSTTPKRYTFNFYCPPAAHPVVIMIYDNTTHVVIMTTPHVRQRNLAKFWQSLRHRDPRRRRTPPRRLILLSRRADSQTSARIFWQI